MQVVKSLITKPVIHKASASFMGAPFVVNVVATDTDWAAERLQSAIAEIKRIDKLLTPLGGDSQTNLINHNAGIAPVKVNGELFKLISRAMETAVLTQGAFDITYGTGNSYLKVELNPAENTVFLKEEPMRIYFGGIAKGYAADRVKYLLQMEGVSSGVINAAGDLVAWGAQPNGQQWTIGTADTSQQMKPYAAFVISNMAVATYGKKGTASDENTNTQSVCIMCTSAELAGAMTAPVSSLGIKAGTSLVDALQQMACVFVDEHNQMFASKFMDSLS